MLIHRFLDTAGSRPDKACLIHGGSSLSYSELASQTDRLARRLAGRIASGDRVLVQLRDPLTQLVTFLAIIKAGGACVLLDTETTPAVAASLMKRHGLHLCIDAQFQPPAALAELPAVSPEAIFFGAFSSGSTGQPKLIWRDHHSWTSAFAAQSEVFGLGGDDILYLAGSLVYTANLNACLQLLAAGGTVVFAGGGMPRAWAAEMAACRATAVFMVPTNYRRLLAVLREPLPAVTSATSCGAKLDAGTAQRLQFAFPQARIIEYYGASELGHVSYQTAAELVAHPGSVGRAFPGVSITIEDKQIRVVSPYLAPAYRPQAAIGDLGHLDRDGYLYLEGRLKGLINSGGVKVAPEQVEQVLLQCPGVAEAVVGGIADPVRGQTVCAWLVKSRPELSSRDVLAFCRGKMLPHCCPRRIFFVDAMPLTSGGKIDKRRLLAEQRPAERPPMPAGGFTAEQ
ncbi:MAG: class I adenylate-forming enzyme family protein [Sporomusaceae bacterium]|nr:class I adenylate-forming enzyme family protein [Sporomusaceae bacterium]